MADELARSDEAVPPVAEQVHLPGPSYLPVFTAFGITLAVAGILISPVVVAIGALIFLVAVIRWVREAREELSELPLEH